MVLQAIRMVEKGVPILGKRMAIGGAPSWPHRPPPQLHRTGGSPFKWIVVGCESGPNCRPCKIEWVESVVSQAMARDIPVFVKQLDIGGVCETDITKFPAHLQIRQVPWKVNSKEVVK